MSDYLGKDYDDAFYTEVLPDHTHVWRYSNGRDWFYCTVPGCTAAESAD